MICSESSQREKKVETNHGFGDIRLSDHILRLCFQNGVESSDAEKTIADGNETLKEKNEDISGLTERARHLSHFDVSLLDRVKHVGQTTSYREELGDLEANHSFLGDS